METSFSDLSGYGTTPVYGASSTDGWFDLDIPCSCWAFISLCQAREVDMFPITWYAGLGQAGRGGQGSVYQSELTRSLGLVFKRWKWAPTADPASCFAPDDAALEKMYRGFMAEVLILTEPVVRECPYIISVEGLCWERIGSDVFTPVLIFERAPLGDLARYVSTRRDRMSLGDRLSMCIQIGRGLLVLHRNRIIHGDLSPDNVLVFSDPDEKGRVIPKLTDFGCSTVSTEEKPYVTPSSKEPWRAPEIGYSDLTFDAAVKAEIFSFGMLCFWLIFYETLVEDHDSDTMDLDEQESLQGLLGMPSPLLGTLERLYEMKRDGTLRATALTTCQQDWQLPAGVINGLLGFFSQTLDTLALERPESLEHVFSFLDLSSSMPLNYNAWRLPEAFSIANHPVFHLPQSFREFMKFPDYRLRTYILEQAELEASSPHCDRCHAASAILVATCKHLGIGCPFDTESVSTWLGDVAPTEQHLEEQLDLLRSESQQKVYNNWILRVMLYYGAADFGYLTSAEEVDAAETELCRELEGIATVLGPTHNIAFELRQRLGALAEQKHDWKRACLIYEKLIHENDVSYGYGPAHPTTIQLRVSLAKCLCALGHFRSAERCAELAHRFCLENSRVGRRHPCRSAALEARSEAYVGRGKWKEAEVCLRMSLKIQTDIFGRLHPRTLRSRYSLGEALLHRRELLALEKLSRKTWRAAQGVCGNEHPDTLRYFVQYLECVHHLGRLEEVEASLSELLKLAVPLLGERHPLVASARYLLGMNHYEAGEWDKALPLLEETADPSFMDEDTPNRDLDSNTTMQNLALVYFNLGRVHEGQQLLERVVENLQNASGNRDSPRTILATVNFAAGLHDTREFERAEELEERCLAKCMKHLGLGNWITVLCMGNLANSYASNGCHEQAELLYRLALQSSFYLHGRGSTDVVARLSELASYLCERGKYAEAVAMQTRCYGDARKSLGATHPETIDALRGLAEIQFAGGHAVESLKTCERVLSVQLATHGAEGTAVMRDAVVLSLIHSRLELTESAAEIRRRVLGKMVEMERDKVQHLHHLLEAGAIYCKGTMLQETCVFFEAVLDHIQCLAGKESEELVQATKDLAGVCYHGNQLEVAAKLQRQVVNAIMGRLQDNKESDDVSEAVSALGSLAMTLSVAGRHTQAMGVCAQALEMAEKWFPEDEEEMLFVAQVTAFCRASSGDWDGAESLARTYLARFGKMIVPMPSNHDRRAVVRVALYAKPTSNWDKLFRIAGLEEDWVNEKLKDDERRLRSWVLKMRRMRTNIV